MKGAAARAVYSTLLRLAAPLYLVRLAWRSRREPLYRHAIGERFGWQPEPTRTGRVWIHAVSLGETRAAAALLAALRRQRPGVSLLLTHGTATGRDAGRPLLQEGDAQVWLPYDTPGAVGRFLRRHRPAVGVLMETEVWPNLLAAGHRMGVPLILANARLSERSYDKGRRLAPLMRPAAAAFDAALAQTEDDARRLVASGVRDVRVLGNLKFDMTPDEQQLAQGRACRAHWVRPVVLAAITREGEEAPLLDAWRALPVPRPLLMVVPRHPQRFDEVAALVAERGLTLVRRSAWGASGAAGEQPPASDAVDADVVLGDSMGEMALYYACADVALLGGSFAPLGGHNLIEAAACGCPLVMGPHTFNFAEAAELSLAAGASLRVADVREGVVRAVAIARADDRAVWVQRALGFAAAHRGAAERMAAAVLAACDRVPAAAPLRPAAGPAD